MPSITRKGLAALALLGTAALVSMSNTARAASPVDCATVELDYADATATKSCQAGDAGENLWHGSEQIMSVTGDGFFIIVRRVRSGHMSYLSVTPVNEVADDWMQALMAAPGSVATHDMVSGYDVARFSGKLDGKNHDDADCFAFSRYGGFVNPRGGFSGAPGYANAVTGAYCEGRAHGVPDSTIQKVLTELSAPVE